jgi:hypothetical protein
LFPGEKFEGHAPTVNGGNVGVGDARLGFGVWNTLAPLESAGAALLPGLVWQAASAIEMMQSAATNSMSRFPDTDIARLILRTPVHNVLTQMYAPPYHSRSNCAASALATPAQYSRQ